MINDIIFIKMNYTGEQMEQNWNSRNCLVNEYLRSIDLDLKIKNYYKIEPS